MLSLHDPAGVPILRFNHFGGDSRERLQDTRPMIAFAGNLAEAASHILRRFAHCNNRLQCFN
jgi:hypothetical protein